jgi:dephospho-CoA kinase
MKLKKKWSRLNAEDRLYHLQMPIIGLTGGIASGKSTFSGWLKQDGFPIIDADGLIKNIYQKSITKDFFLKNHGQYINSISLEIDFKKLRSDFFNNQKLKNSVNSFLFSLYEQEFLIFIKNFPSATFFIYDAPLIFEKKINIKLDQVVTIYCSPQNQIERLVKRDKISLELAEKIISNQLPNQRKIDSSSYSIANDETLQELQNAYQKFIFDFFEV